MAHDDTSLRRVGILDLLGLLFIGLKLTGYIQWSWWWVLIPFWFPFAIAIVALIVTGIVVAIGNLYGDIAER